MKLHSTLRSPNSCPRRTIHREYVRMQNGEIWVEEYTLWKDKKTILSYDPHWHNLLPVDLRGEGLVPMREEE